MKCMWVFAVAFLAGCSRDDSSEVGHERAGKPLDPVRVAGQVAAARSAALAGDDEAVQESINAFTEDLRRSIKLADATRPVDRERAREAVRHVEGVRSVAWVDRENLLILVDSATARTYETIDKVCLALEPLGDTLGVVVNLQNGEARNGDELEILSRNCQLAPGDRAMLSRPRELDVIDPEIRRQHRAAQGEQTEEDRRRQEESLRVLERTTQPLAD